MHYDPNILALGLSLGVTLVVGAAQAAGWKHRAIIYGGAGIGAACIMAAILSPLLSAWWPSLALTMANIAANPSSWFTLFMFVAALVLFSKPKFFLREPVVIRPPDHDGIPDISTPELGRDLRGEISALEKSLSGQVSGLTGMIAKLQYETAVDLPNASTIAEAFKNLDDAVHLKMNRISEEMQRYSEAQRANAFDLSMLLDFVVWRATLGVLEKLLADRNTYNKMSPPADEKTRLEHIETARVWLGKVYSVVNMVPYGREIQMALDGSQSEGERDARLIPPDQRPPIDPLAFADYYVAVFRIERVAVTLRYVASELKKAERDSLSRYHQAAADRRARNKG